MEKKNGNPAWFAGAILLTIAAVFTFETTGHIYRDLGGFFGSFLIPILLLVNGIRSYQGKKTYFWRMFAVVLVALFAVYVFSGL